MRIGVERLTFDDADRREHAEPIRTGEIVLTPSATTRRGVHWD